MAAAAGGAGGGILLPAPREPVDWAELLIWLASTHGPGRFLFTQVVDAQFRNAGIPGYAGPQPDPWKDHHAGSMWTIIARVPTEVIKLSDTTIGKYFGNDGTVDLQQDWWYGDGAKLAERIAVFERTRRSGSKVTKDERSGFVLSSKDCTGLVESKPLDDLRTHVAAGSLAPAINVLGTNSDDARMLMRGAIYVRRAEGIAITDKEPEKLLVYDLLRDLDKLVVAAIEGALLQACVSRKHIPDSLVTATRGAIAGISDAKGFLGKTLSAILDCAVEALPKKQYATLQPALRCAGEIWQMMLGSYVGSDAARHMGAIVYTWAEKDETFAMWPEFAPADTAAPYSMIKCVIGEQVEEWATELWKFLKSGGTKPASLATRLEPRQLERDNITFRQVKEKIAQLERENRFNQTPQRGRGNAITWGNATTINDDDGCKMCRLAGVPAAHARHRTEDCALLKIVRSERGELLHKQQHHRQRWKDSDRERERDRGRDKEQDRK
eukprot:SAG31_NODE_415_length_15951_cov_13.530848_1_plen_496_part_00